jgi:polysaccharide biosynthesis protein PelF
MNPGGMADVCLVLEGTYPYVAGGVSSWTHNLLLSHSDLTFHLVCLLPEAADLTPRYAVPPNVVGKTQIVVGRLPSGNASLRRSKQLFAGLETPLRNLQTKRGGLSDIAAILNLLKLPRPQPGGGLLLNSPEAWELLLRMYQQTHRDSSFLDYFWTWRILLSSFYSILLAEVPLARVYHPVSTGYAGLFAVRAKLETSRPVLLTEHGIYTNERRIEIALADWLYQTPQDGLRIEKPAADLKDIWVDTFTSYSRACYQAANAIVTLYRGNQQLQLEDGADPKKLSIIPNGVDYERYSTAIANRVEHPPAVALIGRVVPIKDVKTYIRAVALLREAVPDVQALVMGPTEEDPHYFAECSALVNHLGLQGCFKFTGSVRVADYFARLDVVVLTSISEAQPLVVLEAGAAGIPCVVTDVGACREMVYGDPGESDSLGPGGEVTPLADPTATAQAIAKLLSDRDYYERAGRAIKERVRLHYNKPALDRAYRELYELWGSAESAPLSAGEAF